MRPTEAMVVSKSIARRRFLPSHAKVRSTIQRRGKISKPLARSERLMISMVHCPRRARPLLNYCPAFVSPPAHAVVLSFGEKSQIQALDRTPPGLPMKKGRAGTMTHDYKRHGPTTLFAARNMLNGTIIAQNMQRYRHQEFIRFLNRIEREVPKNKAIHVILDN